MLSLVNVLIVFFLGLLMCQLFLEQRVTEGLETGYKDYDKNDPNNALILAQQNAGNIAYLKQRMDAVQDVHQQVQDLSGNVAALQDQITGLTQAQQEYATQMTGGSAPDISGIGEEEDEKAV